MLLKLQMLLQVHGFLQSDVLLDILRNAFLMSKMRRVRVSWVYKKTTSVSHKGVSYKLILSVSM